MRDDGLTDIERGDAACDADWRRVAEKIGEVSDLRAREVAYRAGWWAGLVWSRKNAAREEV